MMAKIEIPPEMPESINDFDILEDRKRIISNKTKKIILDWFHQSKGRITDYEFAKMSWDSSMEVHKSMRNQK